MSGLQQPFQYGTLTLANNIFYSPLAGCSNLPYRQICARYGRPGLLYCEMVKMEALWRAERATTKLLDSSSELHPLGAQLVGADPKLAGPCARMLEEMGFATIDFNCGCPVDKITRDGSGSGLLKTPHLIGEILHQMVSHVRIPVSVKIRAGWSNDQINAIEVARIARSAGACALTLHARTREQAYRGPANWLHIRECKQAVPDLLIIGNGDLFTPEDAKRMFQQTGCDAIMASRGTMGAPWLARDMREQLLGGAPRAKALSDVVAVMREHYGLACDYLPERLATIEMRKISTWYLAPYPLAKELRSLLAHAESHAQIGSLLDQLEELSVTASNR